MRITNSDGSKKLSYDEFSHKSIAAYEQRLLQVDDTQYRVI